MCTREKNDAANLDMIATSFPPISACPVGFEELESAFVCNSGGSIFEAIPYAVRIAQLSIVTTIARPIGMLSIFDRIGIINENKTAPFAVSKLKTTFARLAGSIHEAVFGYLGGTSYMISAYTERFFGKTGNSTFKNYIVRMQRQMRLSMRLLSPASRGIQGIRIRKMYESGAAIHPIDDGFTAGSLNHFFNQHERMQMNLSSPSLLSEDFLDSRSPLPNYNRSENGHGNCNDAIQMSGIESFILQYTTLSLVIALTTLYVWGSYPFARKWSKKMSFLVLFAVLVTIHLATQARIHSRVYREYTIHGVLEYTQSIGRIKKEFGNQTTDDNSSTKNTGNEINGTNAVGRGEWEQSAWTNALIHSLWNGPEISYADISQVLGGTLHKQTLGLGLGSYASDMIAEFVRSEVGGAPEGLNRLKLDKFHLGRDAPLLRAIRYSEEKNDSCVSERLPNSSTISFPSCACSVIDIKFSYASRNIDIAFIVESRDVKSFLPRTRIVISEILFAGTMRLSAQIEREYPFFGDATVGFLDTPVCEVVISLGPEFRNIHVTSIPGVHELMNSTLEYALSQYVYPNHGAFDLGNLLCPQCRLETANNVQGIHHPPFHIASTIKSVLDKLR